MLRVGGLSPPVLLYGYRNDLDTLERAVKERVFYVKYNGQFQTPPRPRRGHFQAALSSAMDALAPHLPLAAPLSYAEFISTFRGPKRKVYQRAFESLLRVSLQPKDSHVKVFVKYEKTDFTRKADPVPRVISPRDPRYNIELGRFLRPIEERLYEAIGRMYGQPTVMKGMNAARVGECMYAKWADFIDPVAVGMDARRFDQHVSRYALMLEHSIYLLCFKNRRHRRRLAALLRQQLRNVCTGYTADGRLKYKTDGGRMSGDMNTGLGNCLLMCLMVFAYSRFCGVRVQLANNGDDCVVFMERRDLPRFSEGLDAWFLGMGFSMELEPPAHDFEALEFCQSHPVWVGPGAHHYLMVRHPHYAIAKDSMCLQPYGTTPLFRGWLHAVGTGGMAATGGIPIFQDFYAAYLRAGEHHASVVDGQSWGVRAMSRDMKRTYSDVHPRTRYSFWLAYGYTPPEQLAIEEFYRRSKVTLNPAQWHPRRRMPRDV